MAQYYDSRRAVTDNLLERTVDAGYVVADGALDPAEVHALRAGVEAAVDRAVELATSATPDAITTTVNRQGHHLQTVHGTALQSTSIHWEPGDEPPTVRNLRPVTHLDRRLDALWDDPRLTGPAAAMLGVPAVCPLTSKISFKRAHVGSEYIWHQDHAFLERFLGADAHEAVTAMVLLDDADAHNGALWLVPGSQLGGPRTDHDGPRTGDPAPVRIDAPAGTVVLFPTLMVHRSDPNRSNRHRRALLLLYQPAGRPHLDETRPLGG